VYIWKNRNYIVPSHKKEPKYLKGLRRREVRYLKYYIK